VLHVLEARSSADGGCKGRVVRLPDIRCRLLPPLNFDRWLGLRRLLLLLLLLLCERRLLGTHCRCNCVLPAVCARLQVAADSSPSSMRRRIAAHRARVCAARVWLGRRAQWCRAAPAVPTLRGRCTLVSGGPRGTLPSCCIVACQRHEHVVAAQQQQQRCVLGGSWRRYWPRRPCGYSRTVATHFKIGTCSGRVQSWPNCRIGLYSS
jgi:hypothetical protein